MRRYIAFLLLCALGLSAAAQKLQKVTFMPHWTAQAQFVGYYVAKAKGFYEAEGLDVVIHHANRSNAGPLAIKDGQYDFTSTFLSNAMKSWSKKHIVNVLQPSQGSTQMVVARQPINDINDLKGKKIATWHAGFNTIASVMDKKLNLGIQWIPCIWNVSIFTSGAVDAIMAHKYNEYFILMASGEEMNELGILQMKDIGMNIPEDGVYVTEEYYKKNPDTVRKFRNASKRGWLWAYEHRDEALDIVMKVCHENHIMTNEVAQRWMLDAVLDNMRDKDGKLSLELSKESFDLVNSLFIENGVLKEKVPYEKFVAK